VLHSPSDEKKAEFEKALKNKIGNEDFNFAGAVFPRGTVRFDDCKLVAANFSYAEFNGKIDFSSTEFSGNTDFSNARFSGDTDFSDARFTGDTNFSNARFGGDDTHFSRAKFSNDETDFSAVEFSSTNDTSFRHTKFSSKWIAFCNAKFTGYKVSFRKAIFSGSAHFSEAEFNCELSGFIDAEFQGEWTYFSEAIFSASQGIYFNGAKFYSAWTAFSSTKFNGNSLFTNAEFNHGWTTFSEAQFSGKETNFSEARFGGNVAFVSVIFGAQRTLFSNTEFSGNRIFFSNAEFSGGWTTFSEAQFTGSSAYFSHAEFSGAQTVFMNTTFAGKRSYFQGTTFTEKVAFLGSRKREVFRPHTWVRFDHCLIHKPELLTFNTVLLRPGWFVNVDVRKVDFTDVEWYMSLDQGMNLESALRSLKQRFSDAVLALRRRRLGQAWQNVTANPLTYELEALKERKIDAPYPLLSQAYQRLAANYEDNRNYAGASGFNYWAMDTQRRERWMSAFAPWRLLWWYWVLSGYGERTWRSAMWLAVILFGFAVLYMLIGYKQAFPEAVAYSLGVMSHQAAKLACSGCILLQYFVFVEGIVGPLQVALFALALRRRFMRSKG